MASTFAPKDPISVFAPAGFCGFGRLPTGADGACMFETIVPGAVREEQGRKEAPHINVCLFARGLLRQGLHTDLFRGDPALEFGRPCWLSLPQERRGTLLAQPIGAGEWTFDIRLQGDAETVFFDL